MNDAATGPLIEAKVCDRLTRLFIDTGAMINIISVDYFRKIKPGVVVLEPTHYALYGVTGDKMNTLGNVKLELLIGNTFYIDITAIVVEKSSFPGDLIGYETMRDEGIALFPARGGARFSHLFIPFINHESRQTVPTVEVSGNISDWSKPSETLNKVAERSRATGIEIHASEQHNETQDFTTSTPTKQNPKAILSTSSKDLLTQPIEAKTSEATMKIVPGYVIGSTLLHSLSINKVKLELKEVKESVQVIAISESMRTKRV